MPTNSSQPRVFLLSNPDKPGAAQLLEKLRSFAAPLCNIVGATASLEGQAGIDAKADRIVVIGGDGTLISVARSIASTEIPLIGLNAGKLGFLAEFSLDDLQRCFEQAILDDSLVARRAILAVTVDQNGSVLHTTNAINDCVIQAGSPFRMVHLGISIGGEHLTEVAGDGLIVCTPTGSTAHNLSAGGPILQPGIDAIVLTPLAAHSLTHKPLVVERESVIEIMAEAVNEGTTIIVDGQVSFALNPGDRVTVRRCTNDFLLVRNPLNTDWHNLVTKLRWGQSPNYD